MHIQIVADFLGIGITSLEVKHSGACHHSQSRKLRKAVDHSFSDAIAKVFGIRIAADIIGLRIENAMT